MLLFQTAVLRLPICRSGCSKCRIWKTPFSSRIELVWLNDSQASRTINRSSRCSSAFIHQRGLQVSKIGEMLASLFACLLRVGGKRSMTAAAGGPIYRRCDFAGQLSFALGPTQCGGLHPS